MAVTPRQREVYDFLSRFIDAHRHAPTIAEIRGHFGLSSPASVHQLLSALETEGLIKRVPHASRGIEIVQQTNFDSPYEVPLLGVVAAGMPIEAILSHEVISVPPDLAGKARTFALRVKGDSMIDEHIAEGDFVIVESRNTANTGDMVVALVDGSDATVKRFYPEGDGVRLQPANPDYEPIMIRPANRVTIQGVIVGVIRKYRR
jgi:repressor LexA